MVNPSPELLALKRVEDRVDALTHIVRQLLRSLVEEEDPSAEDLRTLEGGPGGKERDESKPL